MKRGDVAGVARDIRSLAGAFGPGGGAFAFEACGPRPVYRAPEP